MSSARCAVRVTANFERNLGEVEAFLVEAGAPDAFGRILTELLDELIPNLERFPELGVDLLARLPQSVEGRILGGRVEALVPRGASVRQYIAGDYLVLYLAREGMVDLLAIRHHTQLSFDLRAHWP